MNKKQADLEARKIFQEHNKKADEIVKKAKAEGTWKMGLDSNNVLFKELDIETKEKLRQLKDKINKE